MGAYPFLFFMVSKISRRNFFNLIDGLIITGGNFDIDPYMYGEKTQGTRIIKNNRTNFEIAICQMCLNSSKACSRYLWRRTAA